MRAARGAGLPPCLPPATAAKKDGEADDLLQLLNGSITGGAAAGAVTLPGLGADGLAQPVLGQGPDHAQQQAVAAEVQRLLLAGKRQEALR